MHCWWIVQKREKDTECLRFPFLFHHGSTLWKLAFPFLSQTAGVRVLWYWCSPRIIDNWMGNFIHMGSLGNWGQKRFWESCSSIPSPMQGLLWNQIRLFRVFSTPILKSTEFSPKWRPCNFSRQSIVLLGGPHHGKKVFPYIWGAKTGRSI